MQLDQNKLDSPRLTNKTLTNLSCTTDQTPVKHQHSPKRFQRSSRSHSRSHSKDHIVHPNPHVYIRNVESHGKIQSSQSICIKNLQKQKKKEVVQKRKDSPAKERRLIEIEKGNNRHIDENYERELQVLKLEKKVHQSKLENDKLKAINMCLQEKLSETQVKLAQYLNSQQQTQEKFLKEKKKSGRQGLAKLKCQMKQQRQEEVTSEQLKLRCAQAQLCYLKEKLRCREEEIKELEMKGWKIAEEREKFLGQLVEQLRGELAHKDELIRKMRIQLDIFLVRQARLNSNAEQAKLEEIQSIKRKYGKVLQKYYETTQELAAYKRKEQRMHLLGSSSSLRSDSLQLSPDNHILQL